MKTACSILYLVTEDWYFCLHRLPIARGARDAGLEVMVATQVRDHGSVIEREGFSLIPMRWRRGSLNPLHAFSEVGQIVDIYRSRKPDLVHHVALKPSLLGSVASTVTGVSPVVNNLAGLGQSFSASGVFAWIMRKGLMTSFRVLFDRPETCTIVENADDQDFLINKVGLNSDAVALIRGIGVDEQRFQPHPENQSDVPTVTLVSRMLWPKGISELVRATELLHQRGVAVNVQLVGTPDPNSRVSVPESQLRDWDADGVIKWLGHRDDIPEIWKNSSIAVLPSYYREGVPRSLLEAAACGRPIVTTDMPGCREIVRDGCNGLLVPPRDADAIADALEKLILDPKLRQCMGAAGRARVEAEFTERFTVEQTLAVYRKLIGC